MPLPTPNAGESQDDFVERCMGTDVMKEDYTDQKQRLAVCFSQWKSRAAELGHRLERRPYGWERRAVVAGTRSHPIIRGLAIVFNEPSLDLGGFVEVIKPEAMRRTFSEGIDLRAFFDHDPAKVLGRQSAGTLTAKADTRGLTVEIDPPSQTDPPNLMESIERGDITGMSFSFRVMPEGGEDWKQEGSSVVRYVKDMRVYEISVVSMPAYEQTDVDVALRSRAAYLRTTIDERLALMERRARAWR